jgi:mycofactocin precursor
MRFYKMRRQGVGRVSPGGWGGTIGRRPTPRTNRRRHVDASAAAAERSPNSEPPGATMQSDTITEDPSEATVIDASGETATADAALVEEDLLVEEVSIDGMCGVY